jgi:hypothetical protein
MPKASVAATITKKGPSQASKMTMLPGAPRTSSVTLTLSEEAKMIQAPPPVQFGTFKKGARLALPDHQGE